MKALLTFRSLDPRYYQIAVLGSLLVYGFLALHFEIAVLPLSVTLGTALASQLLFSKACRVGRFEARSAMISGLSLCLLCRTDSLLLCAAAALLAVGSKFIFRWRGKHFFNPTNFAIAVLILLTDSVWVSPGQWGSFAIFAAFVACLGFIVIRQAEASDLTWAFLLTHSGLLFGRAWHLGDPFSIPLHQLTSGALVIFAFFMISDPRSTPNSRPGRIVFAALTALLAYYIRFSLYDTNALILALFIISPLTPLIDTIFGGRHYVWRGRQLSDLISARAAPSFVN